MTGHGRIAVANARTVIPPRLGLSTELAVGLMLVLLGVLTLTGMSRGVGGGRAAQYAAMATTCIGICIVTALRQKEPSTLLRTCERQSQESFSGPRGAAAMNVRQLAKSRSFGAVSSMSALPALRSFPNAGTSAEAVSAFIKNRLRKRVNAVEPRPPFL